MILNDKGINHITIYPQATCYCPIGNDWYVNEFTVDMEVGKCIPDYCELDKFIETCITGHSLIIEDAVAKLYDHIQKEYQPKELTVESHVGKGTHSEVVVTK